MLPIPVINKRIGVGLHPQSALQEFRLRRFRGRKNLLLDLPPELRNAIYELTVAKGCAPTDRIPIVLWRMPSLAQVNRQLRNEVIPVYFGRDGGFKLLLLYEHGHPWNRVHLFCKHYSQYLQYVRYLDIHFRYSALVRNFGTRSRVEINLFLIFSESCVAGGKPGRRIGNDETDWNNDIAAAEAFEEPDAICSMLYGLCKDLHTDCSPFSSDLRLLAKHAKLASRWIQLSHDRNDPATIIEEGFSHGGWFGGGVCVGD
ncbi:hypothetical protein F5B21DRAFT_169915 [Xylaria acuta]|nr:hypothetical protein F5B21DRAFT_169915 [Xylaria acuta]